MQERYPEDSAQLMPNHSIKHTCYAFNSVLAAVPPPPASSAVQPELSEDWEDCPPNSQECRGKVLNQMPSYPYAGETNGIDGKE